MESSAFPERDSECALNSDWVCVFCCVYSFPVYVLPATFERSECMYIRAVLWIFPLLHSGCLKNEYKCVTKFAVITKAAQHRNKTQCFSMNQLELSSRLCQLRNCIRFLLIQTPVPRWHEVVHVKASLMLSNNPKHAWPSLDQKYSSKIVCSKRRLLEELSCWGVCSALSILTVASLQDHSLSNWCNWLLNYILNQLEASSNGLYTRPWTWTLTIMYSESPLMLVNLPSNTLVSKSKVQSTFKPT